MFNFHRELQAYEADCVNLPHEIKEKLHGHREANRNRLKNNLPTNVNISDGQFMPQGSMAIKTTIQHPENDYDIDDGVWFNLGDLVKSDGTSMSSRDVQEMVRDALEDERFNKKPEISGNCVRVYYAEGHHVDVPAYRIHNLGQSDEKQELAGVSGWTESDPTEINRWFNGVVENHNETRNGAGGQLRRMVRFMKRFARSRKEWDMPNGLKLTMLTEECFPPSYERDDECFYHLLRSLRSRLQSSLEVENRAQTKYLKDKLTKSTQDENMIELRTHVDEALDRLSILFKPACTQALANETWEWVFQTDGYFDAFEKDELKAHALFEKLALINAGLARTSSTGAITSAARATVGAVINQPHKFYGDEPIPRTEI